MDPSDFPDEASGPTPALPRPSAASEGVSGAPFSRCSNHPNFSCLRISVF